MGWWHVWEGAAEGQAVGGRRAAHGGGGTVIVYGLHTPTAFPGEVGGSGNRGDREGQGEAVRPNGRAVFGRRL